MTSLNQMNDPRVEETSLSHSMSKTPLLGRILSNLQNSRIGENKALVKAQKLDFSKSKVNALHDITELRDRIKVRRMKIEAVQTKTDKLKLFVSKNKSHVNEE